MTENVKTIYGGKVLAVTKLFVTNYALYERYYNIRNLCKMYICKEFRLN